MRLLLREHLSTAIHSLKVNRSRALLTTLGVAIGIASITAILALAHGVSLEVSRQVDDIGGNVAVIRPGVESANFTETLTSPVAPHKFNTSTLTEADVKAIDKLDKKLSVAPIMTLDGTLRANGHEVKNGTVVATTPELVETSRLEIDEGQFIDAVTTQEAAVVGYQMAIDLFGTENPIGQTFTLRGTTYTVIGVLKKLSNPVNYNNIDFDNAIVVNFASGKEMYDGRTQIQQINLRTSSEKSLQAILEKVDDLLIDSHGEKDFTIMAGKEVARPTNQLFVVVAGVMTAIAAISLLVGGIGIMNIMLVSVAERTREIGIRKSVGASNSHIVIQFLIESLLIALLGGVLGYAGGMVLAFIVSLWVDFDISLDWRIAVAAVGVSLVVGILFGLYPAFRAARKDPIESLRQYR